MFRKGLTFAVAVTAALAMIGPTAVRADEADAAPPSGDLDALVVARVSSIVPSFGGAFVDGDALHVWLTTPSDSDARRSAREFARTLSASDHADKRIIIHRADFSFEDLKRWHDDLSGVHGEEGLAFTDVDERKNRIVIAGDVAALAPAVEQEMKRNGIPPQAVVLEENAQVKEMLGDSQRPLVGGTQIQFQTGFLGTGTGTCTLGFTAIRDGVSGLVTNSHCSRTRNEVDNGRYWQATRPFLDTDQVGTETVDPPFFIGGDCPAGRRCRFSDAAFISGATGINRGTVARPALNALNWDNTSTFRLTDEAGTLVGATATKVGRTTGRTAGLVTHSCVNVTVADSDITMICQNIAQANVDGGDSGSPVISVLANVGVNDAFVLGILWGSVDIDGVRHFAYSSIGSMQNELGALTTCAAGFTC